MNSRRGYTLFEVVLVLAILIALTALAYPSLEAMYGDYRVTAAVDSVRAAWALGRTQALNEGRPYRFAVVYNQRDFRLAPEGSNYWTGGGDASPDDPDNPPVVVEEKLPDGVLFAPAENETGDATSSSVGGSGEGQNWSTVVTFLPDGAASRDVELIFRARGARPQSLRLRGFTSVVTVRQVK